MVNKGQTGMQGIYLVAAVLTGRGFIVSVTSRNAFGADLLVTDSRCEQTWSVQVKTNHEPMSFWLVNKHAKDMTSPSHIYVFVNLKGNEHPDYYVVKSKFVAEHTYVEETKGGIWYSFARNDANPSLDAWNEIFGNPGPSPEPQLDTTDLNSI